MSIKRVNILVTGAVIAISQSSFAAPKQKGASATKTKYVISNEDLRGNATKRRHLQSNLTHDQFSDILDELLAARATIKDQSDKIQIYEQLKDKLEEENKKALEALKLEYEQKLKEANNSSVSGDSGAYATKEMIEKFKAEGIDIKNVKFRVQIGEVNSYKAAEKLKAKVRDLGVQTWIIPIYKGYIIPLNVILDKLRLEQD